jgi:hypothetical protein
MYIYNYVQLHITFFILLFVCKCVMYCCHRVSTQLRLNISYHINMFRSFLWTSSGFHTNNNIINVHITPCYHLFCFYAGVLLSIKLLLTHLFPLQADHVWGWVIPVILWRAAIFTVLQMVIRPVERIPTAAIPPSGRTNKTSQTASCKHHQFSMWKYRLSQW